MLIFLRTFTQFDVRWFSAEAHLVAVTVIALFALVTALAALMTAMRSRQPNVIWLGIGCVVVGVAMLGHGLTTPGVFGQPDNVWVSRLPYLAMCSFAVCLAATGRSPVWGPNRVVRRHSLMSVAVPTAAVTSWSSGPASVRASSVGFEALRGRSPRSTSRR